MSSYPDGVDPGQFLPTTQVYDLEDRKESLDDFTVRIRNNLNAIVLSLNARDSGYYSLEETINGQLYFPDYSQVNPATSAPATYRQVYRKVIETGQLPNALGTLTVAHNIPGYPAAGTTTFMFTRIEGCATDQTNRNALKLPYSSPTALIDNIAVDVIGPNVVITVGRNRSTFNKSHILLEYLKY